MYPKWHFGMSLAVALVSLLFSQDTPLLSVKLFGHETATFVLVLAVGVGVDVDHLVDYRVYGRSAFNIVELDYTEKRMIVLLHGIEAAITMVMLSAILPHPYLIFPTISYICHMIMDIYGNPPPLRAYLYTVRLYAHITSLSSKD